MFYLYINLSRRQCFYFVKSHEDIFWLVFRFKGRVHIISKLFYNTALSLHA